MTDRICIYFLEKCITVILQNIILWDCRCLEKYMERLIALEGNNFGNHLQIMITRTC